MKRTLLLAFTSLLLVGCDMPNANFSSSGNATIIAVTKYGNDSDKAVFTVATGLDGYNRTVTLLLPIKCGRVGDVLTSIEFKTPMVKAEDEKK